MASMMKPLFVMLWSLFAVIVPGLTCPKLNFTASTMNTSLAIYGTSVHVSCDDAYMLDDGNVTKVLLCGEDGNWDSSSVGNCISMLTYIVY